MTSGWPISDWLLKPDPSSSSPVTIRKPPRALITYVPLTTQPRGSRYEVPVGPLPFLHQPSVVNVQGIGALVEPRLERRLGQLSNETMSKVKDAIRFALEL